MHGSLFIFVQSYNIYLEPKWTIFFEGQPSKTRPIFQSKLGAPFGFQEALCYVRQVTNNFQLCMAPLQLTLNGNWSNRTKSRLKVMA